MRKWSNSINWTFQETKLSDTSDRHTNQNQFTKKSYTFFFSRIWHCISRATFADAGARIAEKIQNCHLLLKRIWFHWSTNQLWWSLTQIKVFRFLLNLLAASKSVSWCHIRVDNSRGVLWIEKQLHWCNARPWMFRSSW